MPWAGLLAVTAASVFEGMDVATCDDLGPIFGSYWLGTHWLMHWLAAAGFSLLLFTSQEPTFASPAILC